MGAYVVDMLVVLSVAWMVALKDMNVAAVMAILKEMMKVEMKETD